MGFDGADGSLLDETKKISYSAKVHSRTNWGTHMTAHLAYDDSGGSGQLVVLLPGAGDLRTEHRFLAPRLAAAGFRTVVADLPGHGESPVADSYGVAEAASSIAAVISDLDAGPAVVVGCSFAPAAATWMAAEHPELVRSLVMISPHLDEEEGMMAIVQKAAMSMLLRGPAAAPLWRRSYRGWYKTTPPADLDEEIDRIAGMFRSFSRRKAARDTLLASREGLAVRMDRYDGPSLLVFGAADDHFADPGAEAQRIAVRMGSEVLIVDGAGHYPHVEDPESVADAIVAFVGASG